MGSDILAWQPEGSLVKAVWQPGDQVQDIIEANSGEWAGVLRQVYNLAEEITIPASIALELGAKESAERCFEVISTYCYWAKIGEELEYHGKQYSDGSVTLSYGFEYYPNALEIQRQFEEVASEILLQAQGLALADQLLYFNKWLVLNVDYEKEGRFATRRSAYAALVGRHALCSGYTRAFQILASAAGAESYYITGKTGDVNHSWNMVVIDGQEYFFDVTWNIGAITGTFFVFVNRERFERDHTSGAIYGNLKLL